MSKAEEAEFKKVEETNAKMLADLKKDGYTLAECQTRSKMITAEGVVVKRITDGLVAVLACRDGNAKAHSANLALMQKGRDAKKVTPDKEAQFKKMEAANSKHLADLKKDGYTLAECQARTKDVLAEKTLIEQLTK